MKASRTGRMLLLGVVVSFLASQSMAFAHHGRGHHRPHPRPPGHDHSDDLLSASLVGTFAAIAAFISSEASHHRETVLAQVVEDAGNYWANEGKADGVLPAVMRLSREEIALTEGEEAAARITDDELVRSISVNAEGMLGE